MQVVIAPNDKLRIKTKPVKKITPEILKVAAEMIKLTKTFQDPEGVGLASTQIGRSERFFIGKIGKDFKVFFNPKVITYSSKKKNFFEGCLSIPKFWGEVSRPTEITASYQDETGKTVNRKFKGLSAWIFQHEVDHLDGHLFVDKVLAQKGRMFKVNGKDTAGSDIFEEIRL